MSVDDTTRKALADGRAAWPQVDVREEDFAAFLAPRLAAAPLAWADLYLVHACLEQNSVALRLFDERVLSKVAPTLRALDGSSDFATELLHLTRTKLLFGDGRPRLLDYEGKGSLFGWTKAVAVRLALNAKNRGPKEEARAPSELPELALDGEPTLELLRERHQGDFTAAFRAGLSRLEPQQRTVLRMSAIDELSIDRIGAVFGVHRSTAARWLERAKEQLLDFTRDALRERLELSDSELSSFVRALVPRLDVSLRSLLLSSRDEG